MRNAEIEKLIIANTDYLTQNSETFKSIANGQEPSVTAVFCADSRQPQNLLGNDNLNYIFAVKNIGNRVYSDNSGILGDVAYPIEHLNTPLAIIVGHSDCGAVKAALGDYSKESKGIVSALDDLRTGLKQNFGKDYSINQHCQSNIDYQVDKLLSSYKEKIDNGSLTVVGLYVDLKKAQGNIVNINGLTDKSQLKNTEYTNLGKYFERI
ncbi:MAG: carbonic anhydrase [Nanobdellota archaeon]